MRRCESVRRIYIRYALTTGKRKARKPVAPDGAKLVVGATGKRKVRKTVAPDRTKLAAGATEKEKVRKPVAPDGAKPVDGATEKGKVRRPVVPMEKTSRHTHGKCTKWESCSFL